MFIVSLLVTKGTCKSDRVQGTTDVALFLDSQCFHQQKLGLKNKATTKHVICLLIEFHYRPLQVARQKSNMIIEKWVFPECICLY